MRNKRTATLAAILLIGCAADWLVKDWARRVLLGEMGGVSPMIPGVLRLCYTENDGGAWSAFSGQTALLLALPLALALAMFGYALFGKRATLGIRACLALAASGGFGNLIDRALHGGRVTDYLQLEFIRFPIFNLADVLVTVGALAAAILILASGGGIRERGRGDASGGG